MARYDAISEAMEALKRLLAAAHDAEFPPALDADGGGAAGRPGFEVVNGDRERRPARPAVTLFLHRVAVEGRRSLPVRPGARPDATRPQLALELHLLVTAWADSAAMQHTLLGWTLRTLMDHSVLPSSLLDPDGRGVFHPDESLQLRPEELPAEELLRLSERLDERHELSLPYVLSGLRIDAARERDHRLVVETRLGYGEALR